LWSFATQHGVPQIGIGFANWRTGELETLESERVTLEYASQMLALVQILDPHPLAA
jgi:hypothetical protein